MIARLPKHLRARVRRANRRRRRPGRAYVLCWLQQALRGSDNPIVDVAVTLGNALELPVVVYHGVDNRYPYASHRLHRFLLEASRSLEAALGARDLRFCRYLRRDEKPEPGLVYRLAEHAAYLVTDDMPAFVARRQTASVAAKAELPVLAVDAACLVPMSRFETLLEATKAFRAAHRPLRAEALAAPGDVAPAVPRYRGALAFEHDGVPAGRRALDRLIARCGVDMTLPPAAGFPGGRRAAEARLAHAVEHVVPRYKWTRNNPALADSTSKLSPYLHFGVLGPRQVVRAVEAAEMHAAARWKFFDELLTWREYCHHLARFAERPAAYENVPAWGRETLAAHTGDPREAIYGLDDLVHGRTGDETWNAAQKQFLLDGWMHNNLRMYWVKQLVGWLPTPELAWRVACYLNDRLSLDGRDPSTYGGIQWGFGRSRKAYRETAVYGWVPRKSDAALRRRDGVPAWLAEQAARDVFEIAIEDETGTGLRSAIAE